MSVLVDPAKRFELEVPVLVVGAGACGLVAALAAREAGAAVVVLERDAAPAGSTALSSGFVPAAGTRWQRAAGIDDTPAHMAADIQRKNHHGADPAVVDAVCRTVGPTLEWLADRHGVAFGVIDDLVYPGQSAARMHALPERTGAALIEALHRAVDRAGIDLLTNATVTTLVADDARRVRGVQCARPDGAREDIGCAALVLACSGFGGNPELVREHLPEIASALYFGHTGNRGDALRWGAALGARLEDLGAYQGHGSVATPQGILITWVLMVEGGIQVNAAGERFSNEHLGYSEQCLPVLAQPGGVAWNLYDRRIHEIGLRFPDYREAQANGAIRTAGDCAGLAGAIGVPAEALQRTLDRMSACVRGEAVDSFGRDFGATTPLAPPYYAIRVTGALFHTQGGLAVDPAGQVLDIAGGVLPNLFAGGGAARGVSGAAVWGYLSGNGLLSAVALGRLAGAAAARGANRVNRT